MKAMEETFKERSESTPTKWIPWASSWPEWVEGHEREGFFSYLEERFGIPPSVFDDYLLLKRNKSWWLLVNSPLLERACHLKVSLPGMRAFHQVGGFMKPTTRLIQVFGKHATKAVLEIEEDELRRLVSGDLLAVDMPLENGYVILRHRGRSLGLGLLVRGTMSSHMPVKELRFLRE